MNPTRATFSYDRASYVYTNTKLWYRVLSRKDHGLVTYQGPVKNVYSLQTHVNEKGETQDEKDVEEEASKQLEQ